MISEPIEKVLNTLINEKHMTSIHSLDKEQSKEMRLGTVWPRIFQTV